MSNETETSMSEDSYGSPPSSTDGSSHGTQPQQRRRKRSVTLLKKEKRREDLHLEFDEYGGVIGRYETRFSSWVGVTTRSMISINEPSWDKVNKKYKDMLWLAIKDHWNIEDDKYRDPVLKVANHAWKNFKKRLRSKFLKTSRNPCDVYPYHDQKAWEEFCVKKTTKEFLQKSEEGRKNAMLATNLPRLGARGYRSMQGPWKIEGKDPGELSQVFGLKDPRARDFLLARRVKTADGRKVIPTYLQPLGDEIIEKDNQVSQGLWVPGPGEDVLTSVLGPEHPGRTRAVGHTVGLRHTIGGISGKKRKCRIQVDIDWEQKKADLDAMYKEKVRLIDAHFDEKKRIFIAEFEEKNKLVEAKLDMLKQTKSKNDDIHDGSPSFETGKSTYGSVPYFDEFDGVQLPTPCDLLAVDGDYKFPCAKGMLHSIGDGLCHSVPVKENYVKAFKSQHIVHNEANPRQSSGSAKRVPIHNQESSTQVLLSSKCSQSLQGTGKKPTPKKQTTHMKSVIPVQTLSKRPKELQALYKLWESHSNPTEGIEVEARRGVFGAESVQFMTFPDDIHCLVKNAWLDHTIIAWFQMFLHMIMQTKEKNRCGFICPGQIYADECLSNKNGAISSIFNAMSHNRELWFFLAPYLQSNHWTLLVIFPRRHTAYVLDSLMSERKTVDFYIIKEHVEAAVTRYHEQGGVCDTNKSRPFRWELTNCNQQKSSWECGYYIMHFMFNFVMYHQSQFPKIVPWNDTTPLTERMLDNMAVTWAKQFSSTCLKNLIN